MQIFVWTKKMDETMDSQECKFSCVDKDGRDYGMPMMQMFLCGHG